MLSDLRIRKLKARAQDQWISDGRGLYIRIRATGGKSFVLRRKRGGKAQNITLGAWPTLPLAEARKKAAAYTGKAVTNATLGALLEDWYADAVVPKYRRPREVGAYFGRLDAGLKATKLRDLERIEVRRVLRRYATDHGPVGANRLLSILKTALQFAVNAGYIETSPIAGLSPSLVGGDETSRDRVLTDSEIKALWHAQSQHTALLRFLLLTGQRIGEAQRATWTHIADDRWNIPKEHAKNARAHWVALSSQALALVKEQDATRTLVFGRATNTGVQAWLRRRCEREKIDPAFRPHDLRRTFATRMADLGVMPHVIEKILNHALLGVLAVYNRAEHEAERAEAMQRWADELDRILLAAPERHS
jgi:integrase